MEKEFLDLINRHIGILHKICNFYFYKNPYKDDYFQEILIRLWKAFPGFKNQSSFATWFYRVALNAAIDLIRKQNIRPVYITLSNNEYDIPDIKPTESDSKNKLYEAVNYLSELEKAIILLYLEEYNYKEISEIFGISESNTGVKINRIKEKLIKIMNNEK